MSEKSFAWRQAGLVRRHKPTVGTPLISLGACSGGKFVVSRAGEAYDARVRGPNRKFLFIQYKGTRPPRERGQLKKSVWTYA